MCILSNPNIILHSLQSARKDTKFNSVALEEKYFSVAKTLSTVAATYGFNSLYRKLLKVDHAHDLPRILFCSLAWVSPSGWSNPYLWREESDSLNFRDHKFTIIKHSNNRYQIVQGYLPSRHDRCRSAHTKDFDKNCFLGYDARSWMMSGHSYSSSDGFDRSKLTEFMSHLHQFASGDKFEPLSYENMFGVHTDAHRWLGNFGQQTPTVSDADRGNVGYTHIPSLFHRELTDNHIIGCGSREMAHEIDDAIQAA